MTRTVDAVVLYEADEGDEEFFEMLEQQDIDRIRKLRVEMENYGEPGLYLLAIERGKEPYKGMLALPGGHIDNGETPEQAAVRELEEETGVGSGKVRVIKVFENTGSVFDPRYDPDRKLPEEEPEGIYLDDSYDVRNSDFDYFTSIAKFESKDFKVRGGDDAKHAFWVPVKGLPKMAFVSHRVVDQVVDRLEDWF